MEGYWQTVEEAGADMNPYRAGFLQFIAIADNDAEAERLYAEHARYFYNRCLYFYPGFTSPPGFVTQATLRRGSGAKCKLQPLSGRTSRGGRLL